MTSLSQRQKNRTRKDIIVRRLVTFFGCSVLFLLLIIIWHLISQTTPLFFTPQLTKQQSLTFEGADIISAGDALDGGLLVERADACGLQLVTIDNSGESKERYIRPCTHELTIVEERDQRWLFDVSQNGQVRVKGLDIGDELFTFALPEDTWRERETVHYSLSLPNIAIRVTTSKTHHIFWFNANRPVQLSEDIYALNNNILLLPDMQKVVSYQQSTMTVASRGKTNSVEYTTSEPIKRIDRIENGRSLFVSTGNNSLSRWVANNTGGQFTFSPTYTMKLADNETPLLVQSHADSNAGLLVTNRNRLILFNRITGEQLDENQLDSLPLNISWFGNRVYLVYTDFIDVFSLSNVAGVTTLSSLFSPLWYEGYDNPEHIYQTSSGRDFQEAKYALIPLLIGSFKAAFIALVVAIPVSLSAAIYTGFFAKSSLRNRVKPAIEMLEAVPSVVIGFIAAISLAPLAEELLIALIFFLVTMPVLILLISLFQHHITRKLPKQIRFGSELFVAALGILLWGIISLSLSSALLPQDMFAGLSKTTLIVAAALGLAISPTIYTLAEDAIDSVPTSLKSASFALGATRLQTLRNIVLRVAMPGLIAAIMLGFGRAFGETMIVLMVTGNTPIPSWDLFESLRALTANLAIELPEADTGSTLYTILFFTALTLFIFTFVVNTIAEWLRLSMRKKVIYD